MAYYQIKDIGKVGVVTDLSPTDLPPNAFTDAINARFVGNQITKFGGNKPITYNGPENSLVSYAIQPMPFDKQYDHPFNILGTSDGLYLLEDQHWQNVSYWKPVPASAKAATANVVSHPLMTGVRFKEGTFTVKMTQRHEVYVDILPDNVKKQDLVWTVSPSGLGTIIKDAADPKHITFVAGNTTATGMLTVANTDGTLSDFCAINVIPNVDALMLDATSYDVRRTTTASKYGKAKVTIIGDQTQLLDWISSDSSVFTVAPSSADTKQATITPFRVGSADLTVQLKQNSSVRTRVRVNVLPGVTSLRIDITYTKGGKQEHIVDATSLVLEPGDTTEYTVDVTSLPADAPDHNMVMAKIRDEFASTIRADKPLDPTNKRWFIKASSGEDHKETDTYQFVANDGGATKLLQVVLNPRTTTLRQSDDPGDVEQITVDLSNLISPVMQSRAAPPAPRVAAHSIVSVTLDKPSVDFNQGDKETITATVVTSDGKLDNLKYLWSIAKDGIITHDERDTNKFTIYGLGDGSTTVTCTVWVTEQMTFHVNPEDNWYHASIANCAVFNTNNFQPMVKEYDDINFKILPGWGEQTVVDNEGVWSVENRDWTCERVRAFNNRLFALNMREPDEGGTPRHFPQRIRWSNFATENKAPTLWDDLADLRDPNDNNTAEGTLKALVNGYAGYIDLADTQGDLMELFPLKDYLFVYTEFETYVGTPTMNAYQPMTFKKLYNDSGILAPGCVCEVEGNHFVVTQNDIIMHNGATKQSIANSIVKDRIISEISSVNPAATRVYLHSDKKEVWICYVPPGMPKNTWFNSKAAVWNYEFQTWTFYELPHTYEIVLSDPPTLDKSATWDDYNPIGSSDPNLQPDGKPPLAGMTWEQIAAKNEPWQKNFLNFRKRITLGCSAMKGLYQMDIGSHTWASEKINDPALPPKEKPLRMWAERYGIDFDNVTEEWRQKHINNFHFQVNGQGSLSIEVGGTQYSNERGHEHNLRPYIAGRTRNLSVRLNHPYLYYSIMDEDISSTVTVSGLVIDFSLGGRR